MDNASKNENLQPSDIEALLRYAELLRVVGLIMIEGVGGVRLRQSVESNLLISKFIDVEHVSPHDGTLCAFYLNPSRLVTQTWRSLRGGGCWNGWKDAKLDALDFCRLTSTKPAL